MPVSCEGALILSQIDVLNVLISNAEREILVLQHEISERKELIAKLGEKRTVLTNMHMAMARRPDPGVMEFKNDSYETVAKA